MISNWLVVGPCAHVMAGKLPGDSPNRNKGPEIWICGGACCRCKNGDYWGGMGKRFCYCHSDK